MKPRLSRVFYALALALYTFSSHAALIDRGGGLIYDDVLDITWLSNASAARGTLFDDGTSDTDGFMNHSSANAWVTASTIGGYTNWRLPNMDVNGDEVRTVCQTATEVDCRDNELGYMFYYNLGGTLGSPVWDSGHANLSLFSNIELPSTVNNVSPYWSSNVDNETGLDGHWGFRMADGDDLSGGFTGGYSGASAGAWAVRDGDVAVSSVPIPSAVWLFTSGLIGLIGIAKKRKVA